MAKHLDNHLASQTYVRFLNLVDAIMGEPDVPQLNASERALLDFLARRWAAQQPITVLETMACGAQGMSRSTVHRRLKSLNRLGMVALQSDERDNRVKFVVPTPKCLAYLDRLGDCLVRSKVASAANPV